MHGEQQGGAIEEHNRKCVERIVEQVAILQREIVRPFQMREDPERNCLSPAAHEEGTDKAKHQEQPDGRGKGPGYMRTHPQCPCPAISTRPPQEDGKGQEKAGQYPPATFFKRDEGRETMLWSGRVQG